MGGTLLIYRPRPYWRLSRCWPSRYRMKRRAFLLSALMLGTAMQQAMAQQSAVRKWHTA
jgi:hypothetical protein